MLHFLLKYKYDPSYVSRHWALAYYGLISERVSVVTSMCIGRSRQIKTSQGLFHYQAIPATYYSVGITSIQQGNIAFMIATPEKALADLLVSTRYLRIQSQAAMLDYLENDLRIDVDELATLDISKLEVYADKGYKSNMLRQLIKAIGSLSYD
jgi:predicted transcriptional regulator of viral defense system